MNWLWRRNELSKSDLRIAVNECGLRLAALYQENGTMTDYLDRAENEIARLFAENGELRARLAAREAEIISLRAEIEELRTKMRRIAKLNADNLTDLDDLIRRQQ